MNTLNSKSFSTPLSNQEEAVLDFIRKCQSKYKHLQLRVKVWIPNQLNINSPDYDPSRIEEARDSGEFLRLVKQFSKDNKVSFDSPSYHDDTDFLVAILDESIVKKSDINTTTTSTNTQEAKTSKSGSAVASWIAQAKEALDGFFPSDEEEGDDKDKSKVQNNNDPFFQASEQNRDTDSEAKAQQPKPSIVKPATVKTENIFKQQLAETIKTKLYEEVIEDLVEYNRYSEEENQKKVCVINHIIITALTTDHNDLAKLQTFIKNNRDKRDTKFYLKRLLSEVAPNTLDYFDINNVTIIANEEKPKHHDILFQAMNAHNQQTVEERDKWMIELEYDYKRLNIADNSDAVERPTQLDLVMMVHDADTQDGVKEVRPSAYEFTVGRSGQSSQADIQLSSIAKQFSREQLKIYHDGLKWVLKNISNNKSVFIIEKNKVLDSNDEHIISHQMSVQLGTEEEKGEQYDTYPLIEFLIPSKMLISEATDDEAIDKKVLYPEATDVESIIQDKEEKTDNTDKKDKRVETDTKQHTPAMEHGSLNNAEASQKNTQSEAKGLVYTYVNQGSHGYQNHVLLTKYQDQ